MECTCVNPYQDKRYGKDRRVHNTLGSKGSGSIGARCTSCGKEKMPQTKKVVS